MLWRFCGPDNKAEVDENVLLYQGSMSIEGEVDRLLMRQESALWRLLRTAETLLANVWDPDGSP